MVCNTKAQTSKDHITKFWADHYLDFLDDNRVSKASLLNGLILISELLGWEPNCLQLISPWAIRPR